MARKKNKSIKLWQALIVVVLIGTVGVWRLWGVFAATPGWSPEHVVAQLGATGPTQAHTAADGSIVYDQKPFSVQLLDNGQLLCDNGTSTSYNSRKLSGKELSGLRSQIVGDQATIQDAPSATPSQTNQSVTDGETLAVEKPSSILKQSFTAANPQQQPAGAQLIKQALKTACQQPAKAVKNAALLHSDHAPKLVAFEDVTDKVFPKAEAATAVYGPWTDTENTINFVVEAHRVNYLGAGKNAYSASWAHPINKPSLSSLGCLQSAARNWAYALAYYHIFMHDANFVQDINNRCPGTHHYWSENIAWVGNTGSPSTLGSLIATNWLKSLEHHKTIDGKSLTTGSDIPLHNVGFGAYKGVYDDGSWRMYAVGEFMD